jgi:hypothetical protein
VAEVKKFFLRKLGTGVRRAARRASESVVHVIKSLFKFINVLLRDFKCLLLSNVSLKILLG